MKKLLTNPTVVVVLALMSGMGVGLFWFWKAALILVASATPPPNVELQEARAKGWDFWTIEIDNLASELREEKARLAKQGEELDRRSALLDTEQRELDKKRTELEALRRQIDTSLISVSDQEAKNVRTLAQTYAGLSATAVVAIFRDLDDTTVVRILSFMKPDLVAAIFEEMSKSIGRDGQPMARRAAEISDKLRLVKSPKATG